MKMKYPGLLVFVLICLNTYGQKSPVTYRSQNYIGLLEGDNQKGTFQLQTIHGVQFKSWYVGVGTGLDYYYFRSVPLFFSLNKDLTFNNRTFFVFGDVGTNFSWVKRNRSTGWGEPIAEDFSGGLYWASGLGYKAFFKNKRDAVVLSLGFSFKELNETKPLFRPCTMAPCNVDTERFKYQLNRISMRIGWQF
jgi:hypothetical protein